MEKDVRNMEILTLKYYKRKHFDYTEMFELKKVRKILKSVKRNGDSAIKHYTKQFDEVNLEKIQIPEERITEIYKSADPKLIELLQYATNRIQLFASKQLESFKNLEIKIEDSIIGQKIVPIQKVGCYVPGGRFPLISTALMTVIPAKVAGVKEIFVCSPKIHSITILAAKIAGADRIFNMGGVQAIAAFAFGTESVPKVDKIVGPGNKYVTAAKKEVYGTVGIDFLAGPSEILIIADETAIPEFIAADLLAQAEHDPNSIPELITTSPQLAEKVNQQLKIQLSNLTTKKTAESALKNGKIILTDSILDAIKMSNNIAPEHLEIHISNPDLIIDKLYNYGSLFIGNYSAETFGDYCSGTNHILPTNGAARYTGGLSVKNFIKIQTYQKIGKKDAKKISQITENLAEIEGLYAHKNASIIRFKSL